ncbi:hypothetical protein F5Y12DRAFT_558344 [Xylaria sp. FL1777]|nr:hypothetical protein F5Y12DRAFT_558344 [Xylaria sp. FL1777]
MCRQNQAWKGAIRQQRFYSPASGGPGSSHAMPTPILGLYTISSRRGTDLSILGPCISLFLLSPFLILLYLGYLGVARQTDGCGLPLLQPNSKETSWQGQRYMAFRMSSIMTSGPRATILATNNSNNGNHKKPQIDQLILLTIIFWFLSLGPS